MIYILFILPFSISVLPNGWIDGEIAKMWIEKDFNHLTEAKANSEWRVLLMDGHSSHHTPELLRYALDHKIIILGYPSHCTHALQGLDDICFAHMKEAWKKAISQFEETHA